jgi:hypothetical protein
VAGRLVILTNYFDRYFAYSVSLRDVSDNLVRAALRQVVAGEDGEQILKVRTILAQATDASQEEKLLLLHKLDSLSRELPSKSIVSLIGLAIDCFRTTTDEGRLIGSEFMRAERGYHTWSFVLRSPMPHPQRRKPLPH